MSDTIEKRKLRIIFVICALHSLAISTYLMIQVDPFTESLSMAGAANHWIFAMWGVTTASAIFIGTRAVLARHEIKSKTLYILTVIVCLLGVLCTMVVGDGGHGGREHSILENSWDWWFHLISAVTFMATATILMFIVLIARYKKTRHWINLVYITFLCFAVVGLAITSAMQAWVIAFSQVLLVNIAMSILFSISCLENLQRVKSEN